MRVIFVNERGYMTTRNVTGSVTFSMSHINFISCGIRYAVAIDRVIRIESIPEK